MKKFDRNALAAGEGVVSRQHHNNLLSQEFAALKFAGFNRLFEVAFEIAYLARRRQAVWTPSILIISVIR